MALIEEHTASSIFTRLTAKDNRSCSSYGASDSWADFRTGMLFVLSNPAKTQGGQVWDCQIWLQAPAFHKNLLSFTNSECIMRMLWLVSRATLNLQSCPAL
jgi:hypothetical protein